MTLTETEKAEKWDKYSQQFETALRLYTDCKTMEEFFIKNQLPKFLVTITEDGKTKMEKIDSVKKLEQENKQLKEELKEWTTKPELNLSDIFHNAFGGAWSQAEEDYLFNCEYALELQEMVKNHIENLKCFSENEPNTTFTSKEILGQFQKLVEDSEK